MLRQAAAARRLAGRRLSAIRLLQDGSRRANSSDASSPQRPPSKLSWTLAAAAAIAGGGFYFTRGPTKAAALDAQIDSVTQVPTITQLSSEDEVSITSPVKALTLEEANGRLREQARTFVFESADGVQGRVDLVRFNSNMPVEDEWDIRLGRGVNGAKTLFAGVYDGHAGWATSAVLKRALIPYVSMSLAKLHQSSSGDLIDAAIKGAFSRLDDRIMSTAEKAATSGPKQCSPDVISAIAPAIAGSCALLAIYDTKTCALRTAVTGDSRAVLGSWSAERGGFTPDAVSKDQTGFNEQEVERLDKAHPGEKEAILNPKSGRLMGLAVTRAFGDSRWKWTRELIRSVQGDYFGFGNLKQESRTPPYLTACPEVTTRQVKSQDFVILASDGLWDCISSEDAVACISRWLFAKRAGKPEPVPEPQPSLKEDSFRLEAGDDGFPTWKATPEYFAIEDLDSAAVCLVKNAFGGSRRRLFCGVMTMYSPLSRYVRDDVTVQVIFFKDPYTKRL